MARINQLFAGRDNLAGGFGYSDSHNDLPMRWAVSHPHAVNPAPRCASAPRSWAGPCSTGPGRPDPPDEEEALRPLPCSACRRLTANRSVPTARPPQMDAVLAIPLAR